MQITNGRGYQVEYCAACGYTHKTYFREATDEELYDDAFHFSKDDFVKLSIESYMEETREYEPNIIKKVTIYACPRCGMLQMEAVGVSD